MISIKHIFRYTFPAVTVIVLISFFNKCATVGKPTGGDKDTIPPLVKYMSPPQKTTYFSAKKIEVEFDEYIQIKNLDKELVISPPVEDKPEVRIKGKGIYFNIDRDNLLDSTTYTYNFGHAIVDLNESNPLDFLYVFSTGPVVDSFSLSGKLLSAFNLTPSKESFWVMLYKNPDDSVPYKEKPLYTGRSNEEGIFEINYIKPGTYRLFALKDKNFNFIYDQPGEIIAFADSFITLSPGQFMNIEDTVNISDSLQGINDSVKYERVYGLHYNLYSFTEKSSDTLQRIKSKDYINNRMLSFSFNIPVTDSFNINLTDFPHHTPWNFMEIAPEKDSVNVWITDTFLLSLDTLNVIVSYMKYDSLLNQVLQTDTIMFRKKSSTSQKNKKRNRKESETNMPADIINLSLNLAGKGSIDLTDRLKIRSETPLLSFDTSRIHLYKVVDTVDVTVPYIIRKDSIYVNEYMIDFQLDENSVYKFYVFDSAFTDIYNHMNDTLNPVILRTKSPDMYGILNLQVTGIEGSIILQLLDEKENVIRETFLDSDNEIRFEYLNPAKYKLKIIFDRNANKMWDTGNYLKHILPEKVLYYPSVLNIRQNWEHSEKWDLNN